MSESSLRRRGTDYTSDSDDEHTLAVELEDFSNGPSLEIAPPDNDQSFGNCASYTQRHHTDSKNVSQSMFRRTRARLHNCLPPIRHMRRRVYDYIENLLFGEMTPGYFASRSSFQRWINGRCAPITFTLLIITAMLTFAYNAIPEPIPQWTVCDNTSYATPKIQTELVRRVERFGQVACTTEHARASHPCVCCVGTQGSAGDCFKDVRIIWNNTVMANVVDRVDNTRMQRRVPASVVACYATHLKSSSTEEFCQTVRGPRVSNLLRAIELLRGWEPAGTMHTSSVVNG